MRTPLLCLLLGACWVGACGEAFQGADSNGEGGSPAQGEGGEGEVSSAGATGEGASPSHGGDEGGGGGEPIGGSAMGGAGGMGGTAGIGGVAGGAGLGGVAGSGGGPLGACDLPVDQAPILEEHFQTNVFLSPVWTRSDDSVMVDGQQLLIGIDEGLDDYADVPLSEGQLPLVIQVRAAMMTGGHVHRWPVLELLSANNAGRIIINFQDSVQAGWQFTKMDDFTGSFLNGPVVATFMTVRAFINPTGGVLCSKTDNQPEFVKVASAQWDFDSVSKLRLRQAWDEICRFDDLVIYR